MTICPPDHLHRSGCYQRHKCKCAKCRAWTAGLKRNWVAAKRIADDATVFEPWQIELAARVLGDKK